MPQWLLSTSMFSARAAKDRRGRPRRRARKPPAEPRILFIGAAAARHLIDAPGIGRFRIARKRTAERDHRAHAIRHHLRELTRVETAKTPADQADLALMMVAKFTHQIDHGLLHAVAQAKIAALTPAADGVAAIFQKAAQRPRRGVRSDKPGQHQYRMTVALWGQAEKREGAEKSAEFVDGPPLQKHQGFGWRAQRLGSRGHRISSRSRFERTAQSIK